MASPNESSPLLPDPNNKPSKRDEMSALTYWRVGAVYGATAVAMGAFGAHGLKKRITDPQKIASWGTAAHYQLLHSGAVMLAASVGTGNPVAAGLFTAGMTMFSGSIYALILDPERFKFLGPVTPIGGVCLIAGWIALGFTKRGAFPRLR
ncbi:hypothetical protein MCOR27_004498 [Pyricularia oryzae]|uniref:DUF423-domain-containing protein n=5 Tax=Pyricularia TaxID=48558 RepID=A0ABQ8NHM7_PYRGI|nr:uncharacterized protein MGG_09572 [Pyricularia oryzae 70-15]ELQ38264.1 hypothetical protein OOU_Y34scaffold00548g80 [Pyricularia oryzae Y34]KAH8847571.1 hypothetical protein MCOR01_000989 [Pyricularia oryzae]KAI6297272.1 hypothetical protein MCOR33_006327 [Pyricularia grisea]EHA52358.1 hypothetical protein MGG_09572 [Pyricularia oryzae 70-15]KAH9430501.1 hypothetical protein MCOR02_010198 [Pyricularia oryzae]